MRKVLMFVVLFVLLVSPSSFAQKRKAVRHRSNRLVASGRAPVMTICANDPLPSGYWIVKQTFDSRCPEVDNFNRAYLISISGAATDEMAASAPVSTRQRSVAPSDTESESGSGQTSVTIQVGGSSKKEEVTRTPNEKRADDALREAKFKIAASERTVQVGMTEAQVIEAWGQPYEVLDNKDTVDSEDGHQRFVRWGFIKGTQYAVVVMRNGVVTSWKFSSK
jgi:hypothetical protein